ncbi:hypothetical protein ACHAW6_005502 [Cyclotella cf. meneghiniana]
MSAPRIKTASARARAYISFAGLADDKQTSDGKNATSKKTQRSSKSLDPALDLHSPEVKFGRMLGGTDQRSHHQAVKMLRDYLRARADIATGSGISELDLMNLWKVSSQVVDVWNVVHIFISSYTHVIVIFCFVHVNPGTVVYTYMADKVPVQDKLSQVLAELMWCLAGTEEDDEYAGKLYLPMDEEGEEFVDDEDVDDLEDEETSSVDK